MINSYEYAFQLAVPFYLDFVVDSDDSGHMDISIGRLDDSAFPFLNGLEIMKILGNSGLTLSKHKKEHVFLMVGSILGGLGLIGDRKSVV